MKQPLSELVEIEAKLNNGRGVRSLRTVIAFILAEPEDDMTTNEMNAYISNKWDIWRQYPEVIQWFKDNGLAPS